MANAKRELKTMIENAPQKVRRTRKYDYPRPKTREQLKAALRKKRNSWD